MVQVRGDYLSVGGAGAGTGAGAGAGVTVGTTGPAA
jgi:hypothetical protein